MGGPLIEVLDPSLLYLALVVLVATAVQTAIGFGSMVVCVTCGSFLWSVPELTAMLVPLSTLQTSFIVARHHGDVDWRLLLRRVLPWMGLGLGLSLMLVGGAAQPWMKPTLGAMVLVVAVRELWQARAAPGPPATRWRVASTVALVVAGLVHGVFATGGPPLVWALGQEPLDKAAFRTTLTAVWIAVNSVLLTAFALRGQLDAGSLARTAWLVAPMVAGIGLGEVLHHRVDEGRFRLAVWLLLAFAAIPLLAA